MKYDSSVSKIYDNGRKISLLSLAVPKFFEQIFIVSLGTVNTFMLSGYSADAVAATSVSAQLEEAMVMIFNIIISGLTIVMSIELGKSNTKNAGIVAGTAIISMIFASVFLGLTAGFFSAPLVGLMNLSGYAGELASDYFKIRACFIFTTSLLSLFCSLLICNGYAVYSFMLGLISNVLNVVFGYIVLYSGLDFPFKTIDGIAYSGVIARSIALFGGVYLYTRKCCPLVLKFNPKSLWKILKIGTPCGLGLISYVATQIITTGFVATLGINILNAKVYINQIINYVTKVGWAISTASGVLIGRYRGMGAFDKIKILYRQNLVIAVLSNLTLSLIAFSFHRPLLSLFTDDTSIFTFATTVMAIDIFVEIARAVNNMSECALNANGDVKTTFILPLFTCWGFGVLLSYILSIRCGMGLVGCWIGFATDEVVKASLYSIRWKSGKWKKTKI